MGESNFQGVFTILKQVAILLAISCVLFAAPLLNFTTPTLDNDSVTNNQFIQINLSISEENLGSLVYNWNETNYTIYNDSLVLMLNFDNVSDLGESDGVVTDHSNYHRTVAINGTSPTVNSTGRFDGAYQFNGSGCFYTPSFKPQIKTLSFWMNAYDQYFNMTPPYTDPRNGYIFSQRFDTIEEQGNWNMDWYSAPKLRIYAYDSGGGKRSHQAPT